MVPASQQASKSQPDDPTPDGEVTSARGIAQAASAAEAVDLPGVAGRTPKPAIVVRQPHASECERHEANHLASCGHSLVRQP